MKKILNLKSIIVYLITYVFIFVWSYKTPYLDDDLVFKNRNLNQIFHDGISDYFNSNGRFFGQSFTRLILSINPLFSSVCTAALFVSLIWLISHIAQINIEHKQWGMMRLTFIIALFILLVPDFSSPIIWRSGVGNYLATTVVDLLFIWLFLNKKFDNSLYNALMCVIAFVAGWGNENTSGGLVLFAIIIVSVGLLKTRKLNMKHALATLFLILGYLILILSPGGKRRMIINDSYFLKMNVITRTIYNCEKMFKYVSSDIYNIIFILLVFNIMIIAFFYWKNNPNYLLGNLLILCGLISALVLVLSPEGMDTGRTYFGPYTIMFLGMLMLIPKKKEKDYIRCIYTCAYASTLVIFFVSIMHGAIMARDFNHQLVNRYEYIEQKRHHNNKLKLVPIHYKKNKYTLSTSYAEVTHGSNNTFPNSIYYWTYKVNVYPGK